MIVKGEKRENHERVFLYEREGERESNTRKWRERERKRGREKGDRASVVHSEILCVRDVEEDFAEIHCVLGVGGIE